MLTPPKQPAPQPKPYLSTNRSLFATGVVAALAGVVAWIMFEKLLNSILASAADGTTLGILVGVLMAAAALPLVAGACLFVVCALAWVVLWRLRVPRAAFIALGSFLTLGVAAFLAVQHSSSDPLRLVLVVATFVLIFEFWACVCLVLQKPVASTSAPRSPS